MTRLYIVVAVTILAVAVIAGSVYFGVRWDDAADADRKTRTLERIQNADKSKGDANADREWVIDFLNGMQ